MAMMQTCEVRLKSTKHGDEQANGKCNNENPVVPSPSEILVDIRTRQVDTGAERILHHPVESEDAAALVHKRSLGEHEREKGFQSASRKTLEDCGDQVAIVRVL